MKTCLTRLSYKERVWSNSSEIVYICTIIICLLTYPSGTIFFFLAWWGFVFNKCNFFFFFNAVLPGKPGTSLPLQFCVSMWLWFCTPPAECNFMLLKWKTVGINVAVLCPVLLNTGFTHQQWLLKSHWVDSEAFLCTYMSLSYILSNSAKSWEIRGVC